jgi:hypothetical protein
VIEGSGDQITVPAPAHRSAVLPIAEYERGHQDVLMPEGA